MPAWLKVVVGGVTGGTVLVGGGVTLAVLWDLADGSVSPWFSMWKLLLAVWALGMVVVGAYYYQHSPISRDVWTDEERAAFTDMANKIKGAGALKP